MPAPLGGSVVDQSLLRRAADRGVTICFADLDGAEGLWVPEERTVLVNRGLSEAKAAEVIEHELTHVMIDDQHADLDAGKDVLSGHPPTRSWRSETVALAAAVGLIAVVGGVVYGINATRGEDVKLGGVVAPSNGPGLTASESADPRNLPPNVVLRRGPDGKVVYVTLRPTPGTPTPTASATASPTASATATKPPAKAPPSTVPVPTPTTSSSAPQAPPTTEPPQTTPPPDPTTLPPLTPSPEAPTAGAGDTGDQGGAGGSDPAPGPTEPAPVANASMASIAVTSSELPPADGTVESPADSPAGGTLEGAPDSTTSR